MFIKWRWYLKIFPFKADCRSLFKTCLVVTSIRELSPWGVQGLGHPMMTTWLIPRKTSVCYQNLSCALWMDGTVSPLHLMPCQENKVRGYDWHSRSSTIWFFLDSSLNVLPVCNRKIKPPYPQRLNSTSVPLLSNTLSRHCLSCPIFSHLLSLVQIITLFYRLPTPSLQSLYLYGMYHIRIAWP